MWWARDEEDKDKVYVFDNFEEYCAYIAKQIDMKPFLESEREFWNSRLKEAETDA